MHGCGPLVPPTVGEPRPLRHQIFERVRAAGAIARGDVARELGISPATVTTVTNELIDRCLLREFETERETSRGRPRTSIGVVPEAHLVVGLKISDLDHTAVLIDFAGETLASVTVTRPAPFENETQLGTLVEDIVDAVCKAGGVKRATLSAIGVGIPGFVEHTTGIVRWSPVLTEDNVALQSLLSERLGLPSKIDNDANLATLAELWFGTGRADSDFAVVTIEHGVGMGIVINHRLFRGAMGLGLELGHTKVQMSGALCRCGQRGCLEAYLADYALAREAVTVLGPHAFETSDNAQIIEALYGRAQKGDDIAGSIFKRAGSYLALGLSNVANLFDPNRIILSGARMKYDLLYSPEVLAEAGDLAVIPNRNAPRIEVHAWGDLIWARGAAALALDHVCDTTLGSNEETRAQ